MQIIYAPEEVPQTMSKSLFLAGPSPREKTHPNWRIEALTLLENFGYNGTVFIPLPEDGVFTHSYSDQLDWKTKCLNMADVIMFWIPRDLKTLPAFTTNLEFGTWCASGKIVYGHPPSAPRMGALDYQAQQENVPINETLEETLRTALGILGDGALRVGGECSVPLYIWNLASFQNWYRAQRKAGNRLEGSTVEWTFRPGKKPFFWVLHVNMYIKSEDRHKTNEVVLSRPDISTVVGYLPHSDDLMETEVVIVREFRSPAATVDGFIREVPGGSPKTAMDPQKIAREEFFEETDVTLTGEFVNIGNRQIAGTLSAHKAHTFAVRLSLKEMELLKAEAGKVHGIEEDTERTFVEVYTIREILQQEDVDWSNIGMILNVLITHLYA